MNLEQVAYIAEIVGVIAVVASLGYVGVQLKQNREALLAQTRQGTLMSSQNTIRMLLDNPDVLILLRDPEPLSAPDHLKIGLWYSLAMRHSEFSWLQHEAGISDEALWASELNWLTIVTSSPRFRRWWSAIGQHLLGAPFIGFVDDLIADRPVSENSRLPMTTWDLDSQTRQG